MITIKDNDYIGKVFQREEIADILAIANKPIKQLCEENEHLLIFPLSINDADDKIGDSTIVDVYAEDEISFRMKSGNIMGFVGRKNQQIKICSRFDDSKHDHFLHYMLQRVFSFNIFNMNFSSSDDSVFDILLYMFPALLKKAMNQGFFKEYQRFKHNDSNVRGTIDVSRHISENIPFRGTISYNTREFSFDNSVMELIRHTIEYIKTMPIGKAILSADSLVENYVKDVVTFTPSYSHSERIKIIQKNLRPLNHPFYTEYTALQKLCVQILRHDEIKYGCEDDRIYGILFDGAWLWEEYLNVILRDIGFTHPMNKLGTGAIYLFEHGGRRYPDFWKENFVLDAKYKLMAKGENDFDIDRDDVHQVMAYMYRLKAQRGGVICPRNGNSIINPRNLHKDSYQGRMSIYALSIPQAQPSYEAFANGMAASEEWLKANI